MKRIATISLLSLYLVFSTGLAVTFNYCGDVLNSVSLVKAKSCCEKNKSEKKCCHSSVSYLKITDTQHPTELLSFPILAITGYLVPSLTFEFAPVFSITEDLSSVALDLHKYRHTGKNPLYLRNSVFII